MDKYDAVVKLLVEALKTDLTQTEEKQASDGIPVGVSNRHLHLSQADLNSLFGEGYQLSKTNQCQKILV